MPEVKLAPGMRLYAYETLMAEADEDYVWPEFDENTASALCYTSGTTGRPKGVLYANFAWISKLEFWNTTRGPAFSEGLGQHPARQISGPRTPPGRGLRTHRR